MTVTLPPDFPESDQAAELRRRNLRPFDFYPKLEPPPDEREKIKAKIAEINREAAVSNDLNDIGFKAIEGPPPAILPRSIPGVKPDYQFQHEALDKFFADNPDFEPPTAEEIIAMRSAWRHVKPRRERVPLWMVITLVVASLAVGAAVWLSYRHHAGLDNPDPAEYNPCLSIVSEEAPVQASPVPGASSSWPEPPDSWDCHITHYYATDGAVTASLLTVRECKDRAAEMGLDGFCAVGQGPGRREVGDPDWYERIRTDSPPVVTILTGAAAGSYVCLDRCPKAGFVDVFLESTRDQYSYTTSAYESEVE